MKCKLKTVWNGQTSVKTSHDVLIFPVVTILVLFKNISNPFPQKILRVFLCQLVLWVCIKCVCCMTWVCLQPLAQSQTGGQASHPHGWGEGGQRFKRFQGTSWSRKIQVAGVCLCVCMMISFMWKSILVCAWYDINTKKYKCVCQWERLRKGEGKIEMQSWNRSWNRNKGNGGKTRETQMESGAESIVMHQRQFPSLDQSPNDNVRC